MAQGAERFAGTVVVPDPVSSTGQAASGGLVRWLVGRAIDPDRTPRFQALPGPKPVLGLGVSAPRRRGRSSGRASSTGSPLPAGDFPPSLPWAPRALSGSPPPSGAAPASSSPSTQTMRAGGDGAASVPARAQGRRGHPSPGRRRRGRSRRPATRTSRLPAPALAGSPFRPLAAPRPFP